MKFPPSPTTRNVDGVLATSTGMLNATVAVSGEVWNVC